MIGAIIFDLDGVILESEPAIRDTEVATFNQFGIPATLELVSQYTGIRFDEEARDICEKFGINIPIEEMIKAQNHNVEDSYRKTILPVPYAKEVLEILQPLYALGLATARDKRIANLALQRLNLLHYFKASSYGDDVIKGKPDPELFLRTSKLLDIDPEKSAVVEDSNPGFRAGKAAGMLVIARQAEHNGDIDFSPADFVVKDIREIPKILTSLQQH